MPRKKMRKIWHWRKEGKRKRAGRLNPAAPHAFRARRNKRENKRTIISEEMLQLHLPRRGGQWQGRVQINDDFDNLPESFMEHF